MFEITYKTILQVNSSHKTIRAWKTSPSMPSSCGFVRSRYGSGRVFFGLGSDFWLLSRVELGLARIPVLRPTVRGLLFYILAEIAHIARVIVRLFLIPADQQTWPPHVLCADHALWAIKFGCFLGTNTSDWVPQTPECWLFGELKRLQNCKIGTLKF